MEENDLEDLKSYFELLAQIIPLGNWRVTLEGANSHSMSHFAGDPDAYGVCLKIRNLQYADIYLNTEKDPVDRLGETWEHTLIHEILHLVTDELCEYIENKHPDLLEDTLYQTNVERLINVLSYALYNALEVERCSCGECSCSESEIMSEITGGKEDKQSKEDKQMEEATKREIIEAVVEETMAESRKLTTSRKNANKAPKKTQNKIQRKTQNKTPKL